MHKEAIKPSSPLTESLEGNFTEGHRIYNLGPRLLAPYNTRPVWVRRLLR
jgi:hypothetical protein